MSRHLDNDPHYLARRGKDRVDRHRHDNDATTKADKRGRRRAVTTRRKIRGVAAGVCRISRGRRERTARSEASRHWYWLRGKTAPFASATLCHCPQGLASHRRDTPPHRERNPAQSSSLNLCVSVQAPKINSKPFLKRIFNSISRYDSTLLRGCVVSSWNCFLILLSCKWNYN